MKNTVYCWYRPAYEPFSPGKILNLIADKQVISRCIPKLERPELVQKYFPDGLSIHGLSMLPMRKIDDKDFWEPLIEIVFELIRQYSFPDAPSRLASIYASQTLEQAELWRNLWDENFGHIPSQTACTLWKIEYETSANLYDAAWLDTATKDGEKKFVLSYLSLMESAHQYWSGAFTSVPMPELLIPFPASVLRRLR